jgi:hypothetical protein
MKQVHSEQTCAICNTPLKWWNVQTCIDCGHKLCGHHALAIKHNERSSVLFSYCAHCSYNHLKTTNHLQTARKHSVPAQMPSNSVH